MRVRFARARQRRSGDLDRGRCVSSGPQPDHGVLCIVGRCQVSVRRAASGSSLLVSEASLVARCARVALIVWRARSANQEIDEAGGYGSAEGNHCN